MNNETHINSLEYGEILGRFPVFDTKLYYGLLSFFSICLVLSFVIKSPDIIMARVNINTSGFVTKLAFGDSGKVSFLSTKTKDSVLAGDYLAVLQNHGSHTEIAQLKKKLERFNINKVMQYDNFRLLLTDNLGDIQVPVSRFVFALNELHLEQKAELYKKEKEAISKKLAINYSIYEQRKQLDSLSAKRLYNSNQLKNIDRHLFQKQVISKVEMLRSENESHLREEEFKKKNIIDLSVDLEISKYEHQLLSLESEHVKILEELELNVISEYGKLMNAIELWEDNNVIISPYDGISEKLNFVSENTFIPQGTPLMAVIPFDREIKGNALLPLNGAGKIKVDQKVKVKLDSYPYAEYGYLNGYVSSMSLIPDDGNYLVSIKLNEGFITNTGYQIELSNDVSGSAEIITERKRIIERLLINIKHIFERNEH